MPEWLIIGGIATAAVLGSAAAGSALRVVWRRLLRPKAKGHIGESKVNKVLKRFQRRGARGKNDLLLQKEMGTSQIDHLLITKQGIISIETKNYSGVVTGTADSRLWTQSFPGSYSDPRQFYNPIRQNEGHIKALKNLLGKEYKDVPFHSLVVFSGNCSFPHLPGVVDAAHLKGALRLLTSGPNVLSGEQVRKIEKIIDNHCIEDRTSRAEHNFRANLAASAPAHEVQALVQKSIANSVYVSTYVPEKTLTPEQTKRRLLTDTHAKLVIRGRKDTIEGFFESAKRRDDGQAVFPGSNFDFFVCPFTGDKFPASEALSLYQGLWITYLNKNPDLVAFMKENNPENIGNTFRCKKVLAQYNTDKDGFMSQVRQTPWYRNMQQKQKYRLPIETQVQSANERGKHAASNAGTVRDLRTVHNGGAR